MNKDARNALKEAEKFLKQEDYFNALKWFEIVELYGYSCKEQMKICKKQLGKTNLVTTAKKFLRKDNISEAIAVLEKASAKNKLSEGEEKFLRFLTEIEQSTTIYEKEDLCIKYDYKELFKVFENLEETRNKC